MCRPGVDHKQEVGPLSDKTIGWQDREPLFFLGLLWVESNVDMLEPLPSIQELETVYATEKCGGQEEMYPNRRPQTEEFYLVDQVI